MGRKPSPEDFKIFAAMDSDATMDSDGNEKEDSQVRRKKRKKESKGKVSYPLNFYPGWRREFPFASLLYSPSTTEENFLNPEAAEKDRSGQSSNSAASSSVTKAKANVKKKVEEKNCNI